MRIKVSANRMQLMRLKKRLKLATKGHKLLKDKQDQLVREFFSIIYEYRNLRKEVEKELMEAYASFINARSLMNDDDIENAFLIPLRSIELEAKFKNVMSVKVPLFNINIKEQEKKTFSKENIPVVLDNAIKIFEEIAKKLLNLAQLEKEVKDLAREIELTRRRVNALEYVLIPDLQEAIKFVSMKINEMERSNLVRIMKIKEIVRKKH
ncbi:MAG: V-type ATP synthase subunit D [Spirochaetes bacterium]|nr:V-type ATP synthase subunit D [Spirochaetota bacterium]